MPPAATGLSESAIQWLQACADSYLCQVFVYRREMLPLPETIILDAMQEFVFDFFDVPFFDTHVWRRMDETFNGQREFIVGQHLN